MAPPRIWIYIKMKLISHRGNLSGPNKQKENSPAYLTNAINLGFDVEVDVWVLNGEIFFGHDRPTYLINKNFFVSIANNSWFHCKNLEALYFLSLKFPNFNYFWHESDKYTITSSGYIWTYPGEQVTDLSIIVDDGVTKYQNVFAVCSDYVLNLKST